MTVARPTSVSAALDALADLPGAVPVAGGTTLLVDRSAGRLDPPHLVSLQRIPELRRVEVIGDRVVVGAMTTYAELVSGELPLLRATALTVGSPAQRGSGTVGGALGTGGAGDLVTALAALEADVLVQSRGGLRRLPLTAWRAEARRPDELVTAVVYALPGPGVAYLKAGERQAVIGATASAAAVLGPGGVRIAVGGVASEPLRMPEAEAVAASALDPTALAQVAALVERGIGWATSGLRTSAAHRRRTAGVLAARAVGRAAAQLEPVAA
ncbi:CO/xanthine dehydrogenase FAD-binding subunit [Motilibacter rhizosphaerae]|uniref:CO/xanthine dehydrogenase FAD-binding subunit n=1 Tax=Motilibacter rhizosphaerae TaxID=598652 RepID=A0A4Q7NWV7_9ACTN|nr:FAD binding domain-containing protein [Motilibacter rhizosphaerae]RZS91684.1 CO/xanthine dehydrogenase FAD-binding subunit [Motilibacter rhizosphaerae]